MGNAKLACVSISRTTVMPCLQKGWLHVCFDEQSLFWAGVVIISPRAFRKKLKIFAAVVCFLLSRTSVPKLFKYCFFQQQVYLFDLVCVPAHYSRVSSSAKTATEGSCINQKRTIFFRFRQVHTKPKALALNRSWNHSMQAMTTRRRQPPQPPPET